MIKNTVTPEISPQLLKNISSIYTDSNRVFMEYIDNSIDAADVFLNPDKTIYTRPVNIDISISGKKDYGEVKISDNCAGIPSLEDIIKNIGNSNKKSQAWLNGQFGYGIYSFMAVCNKMEITTKTINNKTATVLINSEEFNKPKLSDVSFEIQEFRDTFQDPSGTIIKLKDFSKDKWNEINSHSLKSEIENHFELVLRTQSININISNEN